jgi:hypothetical protein
MGYVLAGILVLLIVSGFVAFLVMNSMRKGAGGEGGGPPGVGPDPTPLGDTSEHAGEQTEHGTTAEDPERNAGEDEGEHGVDPAAAPSAEEDDHTPQRPARPEDRQLRDAGASTGPEPESERLADRPR